MKLKGTIFFLSIFTTLLFFTGCKDTKTSAIASVDSINQQQNDKGALMSVLYQQEAAEYRALCIQAYNLARIKLKDELKKKHSGLPIAIVTDLDETALDNSDYYGKLYKDNTIFDLGSWAKWCKIEKADSVPGSVFFFRFADKQKVQIFYISNRDTSLVEATMNNMKALGFPQIEKEHFLFRSNTSSKEARRREVSKSHHIVLLLGDNLNDFDSTFEHKTIINRKLEVDKIKSIWGDRFIVFPNAIYGEWENALYDYQSNLSIQKKDSLRVLKLRGY
jgi:5'-nucleotidase (lipoprotein e(P4) family)